MSRPLNLDARSAVKLRGNTYWFIKTVPKALQERVGHSRWRFSLETSDYGLAVHRSQSFLEAAREQLTETLDPSAAYFRELSKLNGVSPADAGQLLDTLYPESNEDDAAPFMAARKVALDINPPAETFTLLSVATNYLLKAPKANHHPTTMAVRLFGEQTPITAITRKSVGDFIDRRLETVKVTTLRGNLSYLTQVYKHAMRLDIIKYSAATPFSAWNLRTTEKSRQAPMPDALYELLYHDLGDNRWTMVVSRLSGMRPSEAASVDLVTHKGVLCWIPRHSKTQSGRDRIVPVHPSLIDSAHDIVPFLTPERQTRASRRLANLKNRGVDGFNYPANVNMYSCRVSAITDMSAADDDVRRVLVGHRDTNTGYISEFDIEKLVAAIALVKNPLEP